MQDSPNRKNRGPAAAADNRRAIIDAARELFAQRGYQVPFSAIAQRAGVSQGVLYRHFPALFDVADVVFEERFVELEALADSPEPDTFKLFWARLLDLTIQERAFVEMAVEGRRSRPDYNGEERLGTLLEPLLLRAQAAGIVRADFTIADLLLIQRMVYGVVVTAVNETEAREAVSRLMGILELTSWTAI